MYQTEKFLLAKVCPRGNHHFPNQKEVQKVSLPDDWAQWMIAENAKIGNLKLNRPRFLQTTQKPKFLFLDAKIEKLMTAYLENALSLDEYRIAKNTLVAQNSFSKRNYRLLSKSE